MFAYLGSPGDIGPNYEIPIGRTNSVYRVCYLILLNPGKKVDPHCPVKKSELWLMYSQANECIIHMFTSSCNQRKPNEDLYQDLLPDLKFIIPWTYHAREVVETPSSQLLRLHEQQIRKHSRDLSFMDLVGWRSWIWWYSWSSIFSIFVRGPKKKMWPMETL